MHKKHRPLVVGNWKMNPVSREAATLLAKSVRSDRPSVDVVIAPPAVYLADMAARLRGATQLGVQTVHSEASGAFTGSVSVAMCLEFGVTYAILGHSERRRTGETDAMVAGSAVACVRNGITPIICIGETERDSQANFYPLVAAQLQQSLDKLPKARLKDVVIAYEPVWSIGTGRTPTTEENEEMRLFIYKVLAEKYSAGAAGAVRILYGGSVSSANARSLYEDTGVAGFLVGGASLIASEFKAIIAAVS